jgi:predicted kinase
MEEKIIAVMGATGAGKSSFIKLVTESDEVLVAHGLESGMIHLLHNTLSNERWRKLTVC